jgi:hypothetical protein
MYCLKLMYCTYSRAYNWHVLLEADVLHVQQGLQLACTACPQPSCVLCWCGPKWPVGSRCCFPNSAAHTRG